MKLLLSILVSVLLVAAFLWLRRAKSASTPGQVRPVLQGTTDSTAQQYHAVAISLAPNACDAAKAMSGKRFLSSAAPRLPLPDCDVLECKCRFVHFRDRRSADDRRSPLHGNIDPGTGNFKYEQRQIGDRRSDTADDL